MEKIGLTNARTGGRVADDVEVAITRQARRKGLLGRDGLAPASALVIAPCMSIHTLFMRFAIDVVFVDGDGRALRTVSALPPWRTAIVPFAHAVIELPAGTLAERPVMVGDPLYLRAEGDERIALSVDALRTWHRAPGVSHPAPPHPHSRTAAPPRHV